jgi:hypothetical protein
MIHFLKRIGIGQKLNAIPGGKKKVVAAMRAHVGVLLEVEGVNELVALMAFGPKIIGESLITFAAAQWWFFEDTHGLFEGKE